MTRLPSFSRAAAAVLAVSVVASCAPLAVKSYTEPGVDFSRYSSYDWGPTGTWTGDPRLDSNPFFHEYVKSAVEMQLLTKRIERRGYGMADLLVYYHASSQHRAYRRDDEQTYFASDGGIVDVYDEGTLLLDFVDARTNKLLWRGWAQGGIDGVIDAQAVMEQRIDKAVARILDQLPVHSRNY